MPARHHLANAIDWYINKVNEAHLLPVNLATLIRDISAKQIGGEGFTPRPLTVKNFTDPELDAFSRLVEKANGGKVVDYKTYYKDLGMPQRIAGKQLSNYLSPLNTIRTTLGQFTVKGQDGEKHISDTYDFNREGKWRIFDHGDGTFSFRNWNYDGNIERHPKRVVESILSRRRDGAYGLIRQNAANFGHTDDDPDEEKIKAVIPISDIKKRLGSNEGKYDIKAPVTDDEFNWKSMGAGVVSGAPVGAAAGLLSGLIKLLSKKARKKWMRTLLTNVLGGTAIGAITGGLGARLLAGKAIEKFNSNPMNEKTGSSTENGMVPKKKRRSGFTENMINALSYAIPLAAMAGTGAYCALRLFRLRDKLLNPEQDLYSLQNQRVEFVNSIGKL